MFKPENRIIIVDNNPEHLQDLSKPFHENGIGCRAFHYDADYKDPLNDVRIAFFDINLNDLPDIIGNSKLIFATLADAIRLYIQKENGPFALIFWTSNKILIEDFKKYIVDRKEDIPIPFLVTYIDKDEFIQTEKSLDEKLKEVLGDETIELLFDFENKAADSACKTISQLYNIIPKADTWGDNVSFKDNFEKIISKVAALTLGIDHAKANPDKAVYDALIPTLNHHINNSVTETKWKQYLTTLEASTSINKIQTPPDFKESRLNSVFHIESSACSKDTRGAVLEMSKRNSRMIKRFNKNYNEWVTALINFKKEDQLKANIRIEATKKIKEIISKSKFVAIEISAACDFSQNNSRLNKYLSGIITGKIEDDLLNKMPAASLRLNSFYWEDNEIEIWINLNYSFGALPSDKILGNPIFLLKKEIMDMIGNKYANHISRIGITSF